MRPLGYKVGISVGFIFSTVNILWPFFTINGLELIRFSFDLDAFQNDV